MLPLYKPALYARDSAGVPWLLGGRCECGYVFFPMQRYGCERCGRNGPALSSVSLRAAGVLLASSLVHLHADKRRATPFTVGTIALDEGPVVRTLLIAGPPAQAPAQGSNRVPIRVKGIFIPIEHGDSATAAADLRFVLEAPEQTA